MKIDEANEILTEIHHSFSTSKGADQRQAIKLGIEALKRHQECKDRTRKGMLMPLPGETTD